MLMTNFNIHCRSEAIVTIWFSLIPQIQHRPPLIFLLLFIHKYVLVVISTKFIDNAC